MSMDYRIYVSYDDPESSVNEDCDWIDECWPVKRKVKHRIGEASGGRMGMRMMRYPGIPCCSWSYDKDHCRKRFDMEILK